MKKSTKKLTVSAMLAAISCVLMLIGSVIDVMDLSVAAIASFAIVFAVLELRGAYPVLIFCVSSLLGILLLPSKLPALYYLLFFGWYPMLKFPLERLHPLPSWLCKTAIYAVSATAMALLGSFFTGAEEMMAMGVWVYALCVVVFAIYDIGLSRVTLTYKKVWKPKYKIDMSR